MTANQNQSCYNELENLKQRTSVRLQTISFAGVDSNIVIFKVIVLGVNRALVNMTLNAALMSLNAFFKIFCENI